MVVPGFISHLEVLWDDPAHARVLRRLASFARVITFDKRGTGLSDRTAQLPDLDQRMLDEALEIIAGLWTGEPFSFRGEHYTVDDVTFAPRPVQRPRIPIWVGGGFPLPGPTRRAARWDGACMYRERTHHLVADDVRALRVLLTRKIDARLERAGDEVEKAVTWLKIVREVMRGVRRCAEGTDL